MERIGLFGVMLRTRSAKDNRCKKNVLLEMVKQNQHTSHFAFDRVTEDNAALRLNDKTASIGFIYRHIGETVNLFGQTHRAERGCSSACSEYSNHGIRGGRG